MPIFLLDEVTKDMIAGCAYLVVTDLTDATVPLDLTLNCIARACPQLHDINLTAEESAARVPSIRRSIAAY